MKVQGLIFACCLGMAFVLAAAFTIPERPAVESLDMNAMEVGDVEIQTITSGHGYEHPLYSTMQRGGSGKGRHDHILWLGWFFGAVVSTLFVACLAFGVRRNDEVGPIKVPITIGGVIYVLIWSATVWSYRGYMNGDTEGRFLALPYPTAWMIYGIWLFPVFFILLFMMNFEKHFWNEESEAKFNEILEAKKRRDGGAA